MTQEGFKRKLTAILSADVEGYSRLIGEDEEDTIRTLTTYRYAIAKLIQQYRGRVVDSPGDNILSEFASAVDAVKCAVEIQRELAEQNDGLPNNRRMDFRIGVNVGDVVQEEERIYGDGVNIAARVESMSQAGGVCISSRAYDQVWNKLGLEYENLGEHQFKNISRPIRVYRVIMETGLPERLASEPHKALSLPDKPSIAVLPFDNMSGDSEQEYFSDGITEDIITALSRSQWLFVISRNSSFAYRGFAVDVRKVSKELGVHYILEGSVRKAGNRVRVTAQLIDGISGNHVWAEKYDGILEDIFDLQDQITQQVVASLHTQIPLNAGENVRRLERPDVSTWELLARSLKLFNEYTNEGFEGAETLLRKAVAIAPMSCDAHHLLAIVLGNKVAMGFALDDGATVSEAYEIAKRAVSLNENNEYAHFALGLIQHLRQQNDIAISELKHALELNPNCPGAYGLLGNVQSWCGEPEESIKNNQIAIRINPKDSSNFFRFSGIAMAHFVAGRYEEAIKWSLKSIHRKPTWRLGHAILVTSLTHLDRLEEAMDSVAKFRELFPDVGISGLHLSFNNLGDNQRFVEGLRKAGLPE